MFIQSQLSFLSYCFSSGLRKLVLLQDFAKYYIHLFKVHLCIAVSVF
jgi:hypothetical protein